MKIKLISLTLLGLLSASAAVFYSAESEAHLIYDYKICRHNGQYVTIVQADASCSVADNSNDSKFSEIHQSEGYSYDKAHHLGCVDTEEYIPGQ